MPKNDSKAVVVPSVTDEDPMTSRRITRQPRKTDQAAEAIKKLTRRVKITRS